MSGVRETQASTRGVRKVELVSNRGLGEESDSTAGEEKQKEKKGKEKRKRGRQGIFTLACWSRLEWRLEASPGNTVTDTRIVS